MYDIGGMDLRVLCSLVAGFLLTFVLVRIAIKIWWRPRQLKSYFESQGIGGPPYRLFYGNLKEIIELMTRANSAPMGLSHDILPRVHPEIHSWTNAYGKNFVYWFGPTPRIVIPQPELIKEVLYNKSGDYDKAEPAIQLRQLSGDGLANSRGQKWARQRKLITPAFHLESLKAIVPSVVASTVDMCERWSQVLASSSPEIEVSDDFRNLSGDIIARTAFGSSHVQGKHIFGLQTQQAILAAESFRKFSIPGYRFLPTRSNLKGQKLDAEIQRALTQIIRDREKNVPVEKVDENSYGTDLLGLMMAASKKEVKNMSMSFQDMIDECKTFFVAGHETTAILLTWTVVLLAMHIDWQEKARRELLELCNHDAPNADILSRLKIMNLILHEVLRLYPPLPFMIRKTCKRVKLGSVTLPRDTEIMIPIAAVHHDTELWGKDAKDFNPDRFSEGVSKAAKHSMAFMSFGVGPRICIGQNFSLIEAKAVLAVLLQRFSFVLSPAYVHAPAQNFTIRPQHGAQIILKQISLTSTP